MLAVLCWPCCLAGPCALGKSFDDCSFSLDHMYTQKGCSVCPKHAPSSFCGAENASLLTAGEQRAAAAAWGFAEGQAITLAQFAVQLDQRFLNELCQTGALFEELFGSTGRAQLVKVQPLVLHSMLCKPA